MAAESNIAFWEIYDWTIDRVYSFVLLRTKDPDKTADICQNVYLALWRALPRFQYMGEPHFWSFLFKITRRQLSKSTANISTVSLDDILDIPAEVDNREDYRKLLSEMNKLKDNERICLELRYFSDLKFQDIARALDTSENNAKVLHHRAIKKLKDNLGVYE